MNENDCYADNSSKQTGSHKSLSVKFGRPQTANVMPGKLRPQSGFPNYATGKKLPPPSANTQQVMNNRLNRA